MPKKPIDYKKALIYSIVCKTDPTLLYIGSTTDFRHRKNGHKTDCNIETSKRYNTLVYVMIRANGGWDAFDMKPVKEFPCENKIQLVIEEERIRKEMNAQLNSYRAITTVEDRKNDKKERYLLPHNKEKMKIKNEKYREKHKEELKELKHQWYLENREKAIERVKEYIKNNKEQVKETKRKWAEANKDKISEMNRKQREKRKDLANKLSLTNV